MTGAIFTETRPAMIIRSAWRGEGRKTSEPNRATSNRAEAMDIISIAQHAKPNDSGQTELLRAQLIALSSCVKITPSSVRNLPTSSGVSSVTLCPSVVAILNYSQTPFSHRRIVGTIGGGKLFQGKCKCSPNFEEHLHTSRGKIRSDYFLGCCVRLLCLSR